MAKAKNMTDFLAWVQGQCAEAGVKLTLEAKDVAKNSTLGYFDNEKKVLYVAVANKDWLMVLAHEISHLKQAAEKIKTWDKSDTGLWEEWLSGRKVAKNTIRSLTKAIQKLELDAERRAVVLAKKWELTEDLEGYAKTANFIVWKYEIARRLRRWPDYGSATETILASMPSRLMKTSEISKPPALMEAI